MKKEIADKIIDEIKSREEFSRFNIDEILQVLINMNVSDSSRFYEEMPCNEFSTDEPEKKRCSTLSFRRIIRNENVDKHKINLPKKLANFIISTFSIYSSDSLCRKLRLDRDLSDLIKNSNSPYSILGKYEVFNYNNESMRVYIKTKPVLIIPGAKSKEKIMSWEEKNSIYEKELPSLFLRCPVRISKKEYLSNTF